MRATVQRNEATALDPYGALQVAVEPVHGASQLALLWGVHPLHWSTHPLEWGTSFGDALPCYVQTRMDRTVTSEGKFIAVESLRMWVPKDANLQREDVVTSVANLAGHVLYEGNLRVTALITRETHKEAMLEFYE